MLRIQLRLQLRLTGYLFCLFVMASCAAGDGQPAVDGAVGPDGTAAADSGGAKPDGGLPSDGAPVGGDNDTCAKPRLMTLTGGKATVSGTTAGADNEFYDKVSCQSLMGPWKGAQRYYRVRLQGGTSYKLELTPDQVDLALYAFPSGTKCDPAAINAACADSWRDTPDLTTGSGKVEAMLLTPKSTGDWTLAVDSFDTLQQGMFTLSVEAWVKPANAACAAAKTITLGGGKPTTVQGDTIGADNELGSAITCNQPASSSGKVETFVGPQLYYRVALKGGTKYSFTLKPSFPARLYLFGAAAGCAAASINNDCGSAGSKGDLLKATSDGSAELYFKPASDGTYLLAVDSTSAMLYGSFSLTVGEHTVPGLTAPFALDFESSCKGLAATGDWQCGKLAFKAGKNCQLGSKVFGVPPAKGHSGSGVWGTVLNDCYNGLGNSSKVDDKQVICTNLNLADDSVLRLKVTLPSSWTKATLSYWSWEDLNSPFDWAEIRVDNKVAYQHCEASYLKPTTWKQRKLDLSPHVGKTVELAFHFMASLWVNYAGWYIDDLSISGN